MLHCESINTHSTLLYSLVFFFFILLDSSLAYFTLLSSPPKLQFIETYLFFDRTLFTFPL